MYVTAAQLMCGIAKDLTKLGGKTVTKLVTPGGWVARRHAVAPAGRQAGSASGQLPRCAAECPPSPTLLMHCSKSVDA